jgi:hypothetical protein
VCVCVCSFFYFFLPLFVLLFVHCFFLQTLLCVSASAEYCCEDTTLDRFLFHMTAAIGALSFTLGITFLLWLTPLVYQSLQYIVVQVAIAQGVMFVLELVVMIVMLFVAVWARCVVDCFLDCCGSLHDETSEAAAAEQKLTSQLLP